MRVVCVLRSGGEYKPEHVIRLSDQLRTRHAQAELICLSDIDVEGVTTVPLLFDWPGWWSKMELFRPDVLSGGFLYLDLDSAIVGDVADFAAFGRLALLRDFYRPRGLGSGVMYLPEAERGSVWADWIRQPDVWMRRHRRGGDQAFLERHLLGRAARWQDVLPGQVVSYKADVQKGAPCTDARLVAFHGKPRPWAVGW